MSDIKNQEYDQYDKKMKQSNEKNINYVKSIGGDIRNIEYYNEECPLILDIQFILSKNNNNHRIAWYPNAVDDDLYDDDERSVNIHYEWYSLEDIKKRINKNVLEIRGPIDYLQGCLDTYCLKDED